MNVDVSSGGGIRLGNFLAFSAPFVGRGITVLTHTEVSEVLFHGDRAVGVRAERFGEPLELFARREVLITAGAVGSAKVLLQSGLGPPKHLSEVGVPLRKELPVGENLQDHLYSVYNVVSNGKRCMYRRSLQI